MIDKLQNKVLSFLLNAKQIILKTKRTIFESKWSVTFLILFIILCTSLFITNNVYEFYIKKNYVNIFQTKSSIVTFIRKNFSKAIEIGIVDFSSLQGIIFEDIKISQEEDFSNNKLLFTSKRIDVRLTSLFSEAIVPEKIVIYGAKLIIDIDDPINNNILKYIKELNLPDIYFENLEFIIRANNQDLLRSNRPVYVSIKRKNQLLDITYNNSKYMGIIDSSLNGESKINLETNENSLRINFSDHELNDMPGISQTLLNLTPESGFSDGFIHIDKTKEDFKIDGNMNFRKFSGEFFPLSNIKANDLTINAKFSFLKDLSENKETESYFKRKISSPEFYYDEQIFTPVNNLRKRTISIQVDNFNNLQNRLIMEDEFSIYGKMKLNMRIEETGKANDWIWIDGNGSLSDLEFTSKSPEVQLTESNLHFVWNQNELLVDLSGKLFDKNFNSDLYGVFTFNKIGKESINSVTSNVKMNFSLSTLVLKDFQSIYNSVNKIIREDIKERQEKILQESFFIQSFIYKIFLEKTNVKVNAKVDAVKYRQDSHPLGEYFMDLKIGTGLGNLTIAGGVVKKNENELNLNIYFDRKLPTFDLRTKVSSLFWFDETFDICDSSFYSDVIDFNMTFLSSGNNFSDLLVNRNLNGELSLRGISVIRSNPGDNINLTEVFSDQKSVGIKLGFNAYSQEGFLRNIEIKGSDLILRGMANLVRSDVNYMFSGLVKNKPINLSFIKTGASCQLIKK